MGYWHKSAGKWRGGRGSKGVRDLSRGQGWYIAGRARPGFLLGLTWVRSGHHKEVDTQQGVYHASQLRTYKESTGVPPTCLGSEGDILSLSCVQLRLG